MGAWQSLTMNVLAHGVYYYIRWTDGRTDGGTDGWMDGWRMGGWVARDDFSKCMQAEPKQPNQLTYFLMQRQIYPWLVDSP